jgi:hypothetical protein
MSAIDTMNHAHVGNFFGLPIYWVLDESPLDYLTDEKDDGSKVINKKFLSIGGGSGEHPALIINNDAVIYRFLTNVEEAANLNEDFDIKLAKLAEELQEKAYEDGYFQSLLYWNINQNQWPLETFVKIHESFKKFEKEDSLIGKFQYAFALFIIYELPLEECIVDENLLEIAKMIRSNKWQKAFNSDVFSYLGAFSGVLNSQKYGKIIRDGNVVWGYSLNDYLNEK